MPLAIVVVILVVAAIVISISRQNAAQDRIERWAQESGYEVLDRRRRTILRGPFAYTTSRSQMVYEVTVRDRDGNTRHGYVRIGGWIGGMMSDNFEVRWDDEN